MEFFSKTSFFNTILNKKIVPSFVVFSLLSQNIGATTSAFSLLDPNTNLVQRGAAEYELIRTGTRITLPVRVIGAVIQPGVYYVPKETTYADVLALAGGPTVNADKKKVTIRRQVSSNSKIESKEVHIDDIVRGSSGLEKTQAHDILYISHKEPWIDDNTVRAITLTSTVLGIVVSAIAISRSLK